MPLDLLIRFSVHGDMAYLSHLDSLRLWQRLLRRAGWPLRFSEGYNVRPRLRLLLPRPVGVTSDDERLRVGVAADAPQLEPWTASLRAVLPDGLSLWEVAPAEAKAADRVTGVEYVATVPQDCRLRAGRAGELLAAGTCVLPRRLDAAGNEREIDIRPFVQSLRVEDRRVHMRLTVTDSGSARPREVLTALGVSEEAMAGVRLHRTQITRAADVTEAAPLPQAGDGAPAGGH